MTAAQNNQKITILAVYIRLVKELKIMLSGPQKQQQWSKNRNDMFIIKSRIPTKKDMINCLSAEICRANMLLKKNGLRI